MSDYLEVVTAGLVVSMVVAALIMVLGPAAPYGRYHSEKALGLKWGPKINAKVAWIIQESPSLVVPLLNMPSASVNRILLSLFVLHYANRVVVYPLRIRGGKPTPLGVALSAFLFCFTNGWMQATYFNTATYPNDWLQRPTFLVGLFVFCAGATINVSSDSTLRSLRQRNDSSYAVPRGGLFDYVSCANYFGEILEWLGFAIAAGFAYTAIAFLLCTCCALVPRAITHHRWYRDKFKEAYPQSRKAIFPFLL